MLIIVRGSEDAKLEPIDSKRGVGLPLADMEFENVSNLMREGCSDTIKGLYKWFGEEP